MLRGFPGIFFVTSLALLASGCARAPKINENANTGQANAQAQPEPAQPPHPIMPYAQPTLMGDIERALLAIAMARDSAKLKEFQDAITQLQGAKKEVESALTRQPRLRPELEDLASAIERTITTIENRGNDMDAQLAGLQTRIGAIKVNSR